MFRIALIYTVGKLVAWPTRRRIRAFNAACADPRQMQEELLRSILALQTDTGFGRDHHFAEVRTVADFRRNVPVAPYEYVQPYIEKVQRGDLRALLTDDKVHMFALTSGTTASRKFIPVTSRYLADYRRGWNFWGLRAFREHPGVKLRPIVQMSSDWREFETEAGTPCGNVTGLTA